MGSHTWEDIEQEVQRQGAFPRPTLEDWEKAPPFSEDAVGFTRLRPWRKFTDPNGTHIGKWLTKKDPGKPRVWFPVQEKKGG